MNSAPISVIRAPVPATCATGSAISSASGNAKTPARAPQAKPRTDVTAPPSAAHPAAASGDSAKAPPTKHITAFPPRPRENAGSA
jgi:hypothetical protein